jgi:undecaprenyl-diphosphatase
MGDRTLQRLRVALMGVLLVAWCAFGVLTVLVINHPAGTALDLWLAPKLFDSAIGHAAVAGVGRSLDIVGGNLVSTVLVVAVLVLLVRAQRRGIAAFFAASAIGGILLSSAVKAFVDRPRPTTVGTLLSESTSSYPSGHATSGITVYVALGLVAFVVLSPRLRWWVAVPLVVFGPLVGISRVVMGVHWPTDVLGGWALGTAWTSTVACIAVAAALASPSRRAKV